MFTDDGTCKCLFEKLVKIGAPSIPSDGSLVFE